MPWKDALCVLLRRLFCWLLRSLESRGQRSPLASRKRSVLKSISVKTPTNELTFTKEN